MLRRCLVLVLPLLSCGDSVATTSDASTSSGTATTSTTSTGTPTTGGDLTTSTSSTGTSTTGDSEGAGSSSTSTGSTTTDTTQGIDPDTSSSSGDGSTSTGEADSSGTTSTSSTSSSTSSTGSSSSSSGEADTSTGGSTDTGDTTGGDTGEDAPVLEGMCVGNGLTSFVSPMPAAEELHIFAVYQPTGGAITVTVTRTDVPLTLVLSSYEPVDYTLVLAPGVLLEQVILDGYNSHSVQGQGAATVIDKSGQFDFLAACSYIWPEDNGGCDTPALVAGAESLTGLTLTSYAGCYEGSAFSLD